MYSCEYASRVVSAAAVPDHPALVLPPPALLHHDLRMRLFLSDPRHSSLSSRASPMRGCVVRE